MSRSNSSGEKGGSLGGIETVFWPRCSRASLRLSSWAAYSVHSWKGMNGTIVFFKMEVIRNRLWPFLLCAWLQHVRWRGPSL